MGWRWHSPKPDPKTRGSSSRWSHATREIAQADAIETVLGKKAADDAERALLWRSLEKAGWEVRPDV